MLTLYVSEAQIDAFEQQCYDRGGGGIFGHFLHEILIVESNNGFPNAVATDK